MSYVSGKVYRNRYRVPFTFERVSDTFYEFKMSAEGTQYSRYGGKEGQETVDMSDLDFFDPFGGPFIEVGIEIDGKRVVKLSAANGIILEVEK